MHKSNGNPAWTYRLSQMPASGRIRMEQVTGRLTVYGLGYADYSYNFEIGTENLATPKTASEEDIKALQDKIDEASALKRI